MPILLDTGVLLRVPNRDDPHHLTVRSAIRVLKDHGEQTVATLQNLSEFWNVCTRPAAARGGLGLNSEQAERRLRLLERFLTILPEPPNLYEHWRKLVITHQVMGVRVHDAKLVAAMNLHGITQIMTLNGSDFTRYPSISPITPDEVLIG